jgi:hypothetical protein
MGKAQRPLFLSRRSASAATATLRQTTRPSRSPIAKHLFALSRASNGALFPNLYLSALAWISIASETLNDELPVVKLSHSPARLHYPRKPAAASHLQTAREDSVRNHSGKMNLRHPDAKVRRPAERRKSGRARSMRRCGPPRRNRSMLGQIPDTARSPCPVACGRLAFAVAVDGLRPDKPFECDTCPKRRSRECRARSFALRPARDSK